MLWDILLFQDLIQFLDASLGDTLTSLRQKSIIPPLAPLSLYTCLHHRDVKILSFRKVEKDNILPLECWESTTAHGTL